MLVSSKEPLLDAQKNGYAVGAFNVENMEMLYAVLRAAEEMRSPVLLQTTPSTLKYAGPEMFHAMAEAAASQCAAPAALHLDHGNSAELAHRCLLAGYTSIMIDGSAKSFEDNIALTMQVIADAKEFGVPVEAELGVVGGKEDSLVAEKDIYTAPEQAAEFAERTGVDFLAVAIGTAHGVYKAEPKVDVDRLSAIRRLVSVPLVLHGTSGVPEPVVAECIRRGICKVNYATDLRIAYTAGVREYLEKNPDGFDPKKYGTVGMARVQEYVCGKMKLCGCAGRA